MSIKYYVNIIASDVNIEFFQNPDIESENPVKIRISDFIWIAWQVLALRACSGAFVL